VRIVRGDLTPSCPELRDPFQVCIVRFTAAMTNHTLDHGIEIHRFVDASCNIDVVDQIDVRAHDQVG